MGAPDDKGAEPRMPGTWDEPDPRRGGPEGQGRSPSARHENSRQPVCVPLPERGNQARYVGALYCTKRPLAQELLWLALLS